MLNFAFVIVKTKIMEVITMQSEVFQSLLKRLDEIEKKASDKTPSPEDVWLDNQEFCQLLKISKRTAQNYRDSGLVGFSQVGKKVHYCLADVHKMLEEHYIPAR